MSSKHHYAVILAGGGGTRLWPVSRKDKPKQFQVLVGEQSLLQMMYGLLSELFSREHVLIQSPVEYVPYIKEQIPGVADDQLIVEPEARDTAPAFAFAAATIAARDPEAVLGIFYSDNVVQEKSRATFFRALEEGFNAIECFPDHLVVVGVRPLYPHTGLGYVELGAREHIPGHTTPMFHAKAFVEKPELEDAKRLAASPNYLWNTGYKIVRAEHVLRLLAERDDAYAGEIPALTRAIAARDEQKTQAAFKALPRQTFEYLISEQEKKLLVMAADIDWSDLGDWEIIHRVLAEGQEAGLFSAGKVVKHHCEDTLLLSYHRPVVALGVQDLIVIETKDAVLVMSKKHSQDVKLALQELLKREPELN